MMQASTSLMLSRALKRPGIAPQIAPASVPPRKASSQMSVVDIVSDGRPRAMESDTSVPMRYWPGAPMLKRPVLYAMPTERPVMMSGAARKSMLPIFVGLKPHISVPEASRPVENRPPNTMRMPSHAEESERFGLVRPTIKMTMLPTARPIRIERTDAATVLKPSLCRKCSFFIRPPPPSPCAWRRPCKGRALRRWFSSGRARRRSRPRT